MSKDLLETIAALDEELTRSKQFVNENNFHHGTSVYVVVSRYRKELKELRKTIMDDVAIDGIKNYDATEKSVHY
jgi:hypothetical protein